MGRGLHMIIYYHCTSDNALFHQFLHQESCISELIYGHAQQKNDHTFITTPSRRIRSRAMVSLIRGGKSRIVTNTYYVKSTKVLLVKRHIACPNRTDLRELYRLT